MKTIIIPADLTNFYYNSLNTALLLENSRPVEFVISFSNETDKEQVHAKFNEIKAKYEPGLRHPESKMRLITDKLSSQPECGDISPSSSDNLVFLSYFHDSAEETSDYSVENTVKYIRGCRQNYLTIPHEYKIQKINRIIFPVHILSKVRHKVTFTSVIAKMFDAEVHVVTLQTTNQKDVIKRLNLYTLQVINHFRNYGIATQFDTLEGKKVPEMIMEYTASTNGDLVSIIPEEIKGPRFFSKGFLYEMIEKANVPLVVVAPRKAKISGSFSASG